MWLLSVKCIALVQCLFNFRHGLFALLWNEVKLARWYQELSITTSAFLATNQPFLVSLSPHTQWHTLQRRFFSGLLELLYIFLLVTFVSLISLYALFYLFILFRIKYGLFTAIFLISSLHQSLFRSLFWLLRYIL